MMRRAIYSIPLGTTLDSLTPDQQAAIASVFAQFVNPMIGTISTSTTQIVDGIVGDNFDPNGLAAIGLGNWTCIGLWSWDEASPTLTEIIPLDGATLLAHLPETHDYDANGNIAATYPAVLHVPHNWAGWPPVEII